MANRDEAQRTKGPVFDGPAPPDGTPIYDENGVDRTLVRWMLSLTPTERLAVLQDHIDFATRVRILRDDE